jgi:hypothetical protein
VQRLANRIEVVQQARFGHLHLIHEGSHPAARTISEMRCAMSSR